MTFATVPLIRRRRGPANEAAVYRPMWEGRAQQAGWLTAIVQAQALNGVTPSSGWVRARNVTTGALTADVPVATADGTGIQVDLPELAVATGDLIEIQARPGTSGHQLYLEQAAATISSVPLTLAPAAASPAVFGALSISPTPPTLSGAFTLQATVISGSCDLAGQMTVEVEWRTPDGSNPMSGTSVGGGFYRGLQKTLASPGALTWTDSELVTSVAGLHRIRFAATNSTGVTVSAEIQVTVADTAPTVRGTYFTAAPAATHSISSASVSPALQVGDKVLLIISAPGPAEKTGLVYSHPGTTVATIPGSSYKDQARLALVDYTGATTWNIAVVDGASAQVTTRVAAVGLHNAASITAGTPAYSTTPTDPGGVANVANSLGLAVTLLNFTDGEVTAPPTSHTTVLNSLLANGVRQIYVASLATASSGTYNPAAATVGPSTEDGTSIALTVAPSAAVGSGSTSAPTVPTFNTGAAVTINPGDNAAAIVAAQPEGTHFTVAAGTHGTWSDVRPKTGMHFKGAGQGVTILEGTGKAYCFRSGTLGTSDNVTIGNMTIRNYGQGTSRQDYGAIQSMPTDTVGGQYTYGHSNNWFIYSVTLATNAANGIDLSDNCTVYQCTAYGHTVTGIHGDRVVGGLIHSCTLEANALDPATGNSSNGANLKCTWHNGGPGRTSVVPSAWQRPIAPLVVANCTSNATRSGITGTCRIGMWFDLDCQNVLVDGSSFANHTTSAVFFEGSNNGTVHGCSIDNCDGFGGGFDEDFINGALACGESTNITFDANTLSNCTNALVNRLSNRTGDWLNPTGTDNYGYASGPRYWLLATTSIPSTTGQSNVWTGANTWSNNVLTSCLKVLINEGSNTGGQATHGATVLSSIHFTGQDYSASPSIAFYEVSNTSKTLAQWKALPNDRDQ